MLTQLHKEFDGHLQQAIADVQALKETLILEQNHLKNNDLDAFQELQVIKHHGVQTIQLFDALRNQFCTNADISKEDQHFSHHLLVPQQALWQQLLDLLAECDKLHRTSDAFMRTKLKSINKALDILELNSTASSTNLYNGLGNAFKSNIGRSLDKA